MIKEGAVPVLDKRLERMSSIMDELYHRALKNEQILHKYQSFELRLLSQDTITELITTLIDGAMAHFDLSAVELWLHDAIPNLLDVLPAQFSECLRIVPETDMATLFESCGQSDGQPLVSLVNRSFLQEKCLFAGQSIGSAALIPLMRAGKWMGSLHLGSVNPQRFTKQMSTDFMGHLGVLAAIAIENALNREMLHRLSLTDGLTGVVNRRGFHSALEKEISLAQRRQEPLSLFLIDLDYFKQINDTHGHQCGDNVLVYVSRAILKLLRKSDHVCRYGGEEFAIILPNCDRQLAMDVAERIRLYIAEAEISGDLGQLITLTLSVGVACWTPQIQKPLTIDGLVRSADDAVYRAKKAGRNCVRYNNLIF